MRTLGLIGGTSWVSTLDYYKLLNRGINQSLGGLNSCKLMVYSVNFQEFKNHFDQDDWAWVAQELTEIAAKLEKAGADAIMLCSNTTHLVADQIISKIGIPLLHIADATADCLRNNGIHKTALLGTQFTMEHGYFQKKLLEKGIETLIPDKEDRDYLNRNIFEELTKEVFTPTARQKYLDIIKGLKDQGAEAVIYGCTEIPILLEGHNTGIPSFDTLQIHVDYGIRFALEG